MMFPFTSFGIRKIAAPSISAQEREQLNERLLGTNTNIARYMALISIAIAPLLLIIDIQRWQKGAFTAAPLYWMLAVLHVALVISAAPGLLLWLQNKVAHSTRVIAVKVHLVTLTTSLAGMGILGILERGGLVLVAIALLCTNLVYEISFRQRMMFNLGLSVAGALTLLVFSSGEMLKVVIATAELLALVLISTVAGELRFRDLIALALAEHRLARMAYFDVLTGLANRRHLEQHMNRHLSAVARGRALTVVMVDVDHFKSVNDAFGHEVGDSVLKTVAELLMTGIRPMDIVGRWGGEEFLIVCPDTGAETGRLVAERLATTLRAREIAEAGRRTASFGVAQAEQSDTIKSLLVRADQALYEAKNTGRDRVCVAA